MSYVRVDSSVPRNRKFLQAGPAASWLWLCGLAYCQEGLTDGFIPREALPTLGVLKDADRLATRLVLAHLWECTDDGWRVHDYLEHNRSAADVGRIRDERRDAGRVGGKASGESRSKQVAEANAKQVAEATLETPSKQPSNPSTSTSTEATTATASTTATGRGASLVARRNLHAAFEGARSLYVLQGQHQKFLGLLNGSVTEADLFAWYELTAEAWATGPFKDQNTGPDMPKFWDARFTERWPPAMTPTVDKWEASLPKWARDARARAREGGPA